MARLCRTALLALLYFLVVTPAGLLLRLVRDPLSRAYQPSAPSYWRDVDEQHG